MGRRRHSGPTYPWTDPVKSGGGATVDKKEGATPTNAVSLARMISDRPKKIGPTHAQSARKIAFVRSMRQKTKRSRESVSVSSGIQ